MKSEKLRRFDYRSAVLLELAYAKYPKLYQSIGSNDHVQSCNAVRGKELYSSVGRILSLA